MAYQEYSITTLDDVPALVRSFAANMGWNVVGGNLRHPNYDGAGPGGLAFEIYTVSNSLNHDLFFRCTTDPSRSARIRAPIWSTTVTPFTGYKVAPTKLFLIGMLDPEPYIAVVVEFGYNLYRHLYLGYMEKQGTYGGGSVLGACTGVEVSVNGTPHFKDKGYLHYLFQGHQRMTSASEGGGVEVIQADIPNPWRNFRDINGAPSTTLMPNVNDNTCAYGGFGDDLNDNYVYKGKSSIAGANVLVPINCAVVRHIGTDFRLKPIGIPTGVRMINIQEIEPQAQIEVGGDNWYVFAAISKNADAYGNRRPNEEGNRYRISESSYYLGYAYRG